MISDRGGKKSGDDCSGASEAKNERITGEQHIQIIDPHRERIASVYLNIPKIQCS